MAAPTFVSYTASTFTQADVAKTVNVAVLTGDIIVVCGSTEDGNYTLATPSDTVNTYSLAQSIVVASNATAYVWTATAASSTTLTISVSPNFTAQNFGFGVFLFRSSAGVGASAKTNSTGAPSLSLTTTVANSAIVCISADWNAVDGASRTWRTINSAAATEETYFRDSAAFTVYTGYWPDAGTAAAKTTGLSAPTGQKYAIISLEVKASSVTTVTASDAGHFLDTRSPVAAVSASSDAGHGAESRPVAGADTLTSQGDAAHWLENRSPVQQNYNASDQGHWLESRSPLDLGYSASDAGHGRDSSTLPIVATSNLSDVAHWLESAQAIRVIDVSDSGTWKDYVISRTLTSSDSGRGSDSGQVGPNTSDQSKWLDYVTSKVFGTQDAGHFLETSSLFISGGGTVVIAASDEAHWTERPSIAAVATTSDSGHGSEGTSSEAITETTSDASHWAALTSSLSAVLNGQDAGKGSEGKSSVSVSELASDLAHFRESPSILAVLSALDRAHWTETSSLGGGTNPESTDLFPFLETVTLIKIDSGTFVLGGTPDSQIIDRKPSYAGITRTTPSVGGISVR